MTDAEIAAHYQGQVSEQVLLNALAATGRDLAALTVADLAPADEFHIGGRKATAALLAQVPISAEAHWLDIGSGIGGPARHIAQATGCRVTGIDLTEPYVEIARSLTARVGLGDRVDFVSGSALELPFPDAHFDGATLFHVGMNIGDKARLCAEAARVLRPGATFVVYDVMRTGPGELVFPVPWASGPATSFVAPLQDYRDALEAAGFALRSVAERGTEAIEFFRNLRPAPGGFGLNLVMGENFRTKVANLLANLDAGRVAPVEVLASRA